MENHQAGNRKLVFLITENRGTKQLFTAAEARMGADSSSRMLLRHLFLQARKWIRNLSWRERTMGIFAKGTLLAVAGGGVCLEQRS